MGLMEEFQTNLKQLADQSDRLLTIDPNPETAQMWSQFLQEFQQITMQATDLNAFVGCHSAADSENKLFQRLEAELSAFDILRERIATNIELTLRDADQADLRGMLAADDWLNQISFYLHDRQLAVQLRLPKELDNLAAELAVDGIHAWGRLYDRLSGGLRVTLMEKGELVKKSPGQVRYDSPIRDVRENNFYAADKAWQTIADSCADALNHISGTRLTQYRRLGLEDHLVAPLRYNRLQRETLNRMWSCISERKTMLVKYLQAKASLMGQEKLAWYDLSAPTSNGSSTEITYDQACEMIIQTFTDFSSEFGDFAKMALEQSWIEAEDRSGKRQGGFCTGFPSHQVSRIFMTFTNSADSMSTLAHELGHAYHSFVLKEQPLFLRRYPMNLAETASTFAEAVLGKQRLATAREASEELEILDQMLGDAVSYLMNIHARFLFEDAFHVERSSGEVSAKKLSDLMLQAQQQAYEQALEEDGYYPGFWISKLHFYISTLPFYNFPYTFGYLLSLGLYALVEDAKSDFPSQYRDFLIATGCMETEDAIKSTFGHGLREADFWNKSLDIVESRVDRFLELTPPIDALSEKQYGFPDHDAESRTERNFPES